MTTSITKANRRNTLTGVSGAVALLSLIGLGLIYIRQNSDTSKLADQNKHQLSCMKRWADANSARSTYIAKYLRPRNDAFDRLEVAILHHESPTQLNALRAAYLTRSRAYSDAQASNPVPPPPEFNCADGKGSVASSGGVTTPAPRSPVTPPPTSPDAKPSSSAHALPRMTITVTRTPAPGATRTLTVLRDRVVTLPGPTVTRTVTRTEGAPLIVLPSIGLNLP